MEHIRKMAAETTCMVVQSVEAYVEKDEEKAKEVIAHDDIIDDLFIKSREDVISLIRSNPEVTGRGVGFNTVIETAQKAGYKGELPRSSDLYTGRFSVPLSHAVNALYLIGNDGLNVSISSVRQVGTTKKNLVMVNAPSPEESRREILPRESAHLVASLPPFRYDERTRKTFVNVKLPGNTGHFSAVMGRYFTVFAWVGFDSPEAAVYEKKGVSAALAKTCSSLAGEVYDRAEEGRRKAVRERRERENAAEQGPQ